MPALMLSQVVPVLYQNELLVVSYTSKPLVLGMDNLASESIRGIRMPLLADLTSKIALGLAKEPSALMARFWPVAKNMLMRHAEKSMKSLFIEES